MTKSHPTPYAGSWYPGAPSELLSLLDNLFEASEQRTGPVTLPRPLAFVVPHAGLSYSGTAAAAAYRHLEAARPQRIFVLGFSHRGGPAGIALPDIAAYQSPLGEVPVDRECLLALASAPHFRLLAESRLCDHSIEIQLPFLQRAAAGVPVVPLYVGPLSEDERIDVAHALSLVMRPGDILLASSDFTHYGADFGHLPFPPDSSFSWRIQQLDSAYIDAASSLQPEFFLETLRGRAATVCGAAPISLMLEVVRLLLGEEGFQQTLDYQTSAEITGDRRHSVSYAALGYFRVDSFWLEPEACRALIAAARSTLDRLRETGDRQPAPPPPGHASLERRSGVFVSLHRGHDLFGCIGVRTGKAPLSTMVPEMALAAALDDPRFHHHGELPADLEIEISVLSPMKRIPHWSAFQLGRDGASLELGGRNSLLLPQVAGPAINTPARFLEALAHKAGLPASAYSQPDVQLSTFRAQVFT